MNPFDRKKFIASAENYLLGQLQKWLAGIKGTALEPILLKLARQDWILETENLEAITIWNIFRDIDLKATADAIEAGRTPEKEAKIYIANIAARNLKDIADELQKLEDTNPSALKAEKPLLIIGDEPPNNPPPLPVGEPPLSGEVRGFVAEVKSSPRICHTVEIDKHSLYTFDKSLAETAKAALRQKMHLLAVWTIGEFGCKLETLKPCDAPKPTLVI
jgi:hypothetical protein